MLFTFSPAVLQQHMSDHAKLAVLAQRPDLVAMHQELAIFYHEQIIRLVLDEGLALVG